MLNKTFVHKKVMSQGMDKKSLLTGLLENSYILCLFIACMTRIYFYMYPKNIWLDEASIALAINQGSWVDILRGHLGYFQSCPIGFAIINKILNLYTSYTQQILYIVPTLLGIALLILMCRLCMAYDKNRLFVFLCISILAICKVPLYYSSELKQYIYEMVVTVVLFSIFFNDLRKKYDRDIFISLKYPILFIFCLIFSNPSLFIIISFCFTIYIYVLCQERVGLIRITCAFISRYVIFGIFCILYYLFYLKNEELARHMYSYWGKYFIPHDIHEIPNYMVNIFMPIFISLLRVVNIKYFSFFLLPFFLVGFFCIYKKNKYEFLSLLLPFIVATLAAFGFYPLGHYGVIGVRLSSYLIPIIVFIASYGMYKILYFLYIKSKIKKCYVYFSCVVAIVFVLNMNVAYLSSDMKHQQTFSFFDEIKKEYAEGDLIYVYGYTENVFKYWMLINHKKFDYVVIDGYENMKKQIFNSQNEIAEKKKIFVVYSHLFENESIPRQGFNIFKKLGYSIQVKKDAGAELHIVYKQ